MTLNRKILSALILSGLTLGLANASDLVQMDIKKTSENAVDVTFYATEASGSPIVTRKSNNKYVVLMPNVAGKNAGTPDLSSVRDIISDVDIKNVDDGMNGYTKVTFITTKPVNITTNVKKTAPLTKEETEARTLIAQAKTHPQQKVAPSEPKKEVSATKVTSSSGSSTNNAAKKTENKVKEAKSVQPAKEVKSTQPAKEVKQQKPEPPKTVKKENIITPPEKKAEPVKDTAKKTAKTETLAPVEKAPTATENFTNTENLNLKDLDRIEKVAKNKKPSGKSSSAALIIFPILALFLFIKFLKTAVQKSNALRTSFNENLHERPYRVTENYNDLIEDDKLNWQERYQKFVEESSPNKTEEKPVEYKFISTPKPVQKQVKEAPVKQNTAKTNELKPTGIPKAIKVTSSAKPSAKTLPFVNKKSAGFIPAQKSAQNDNVNKISSKPQNKAGMNYSNDDGVELKKFSDFGDIKFISRYDKAKHSSASDMTESDRQRLAFERVLSKTPDIYRKKWVDLMNNPSDRVIKEDDSINRDLQSIKLKAFANPPSYKTTNRDRMIKDFIEPTGVDEVPHVKLKENKLNLSSRSFKDANLKVNEMKIKERYKSSKIKPYEMEEIKNEQKYIVSSLDEYFNILDTEKTTQRSDLSEKVAASLANIKPSMRMRHDVTTSGYSNNPISGKSSRDYLSGLVVKQSYNIDEHKGLYLVSLDGANALVGRIDSEIFVLEKFDSETDKMQVRLDSDNVYMVKAGKYKALIDVNDKKMGVLIQL